MRLPVMRKPGVKEMVVYAQTSRGSAETVEQMAAANEEPWDECFC
jgi:hypothetical protein